MRAALPAMPALERLLLPLLLPLALPACGVGFLPGEPGTEMFKDMELRGAFIAGSELIVSVEIAASYPIAVRVACLYESRDLSEEQRRVAFQERATLIGERILDPVPGSRPGEDAERRTLRFAFSVPQPGEYVVACITPAAPENGIRDDFTVRSPLDTSA